MVRLVNKIISIIITVIAVIGIIFLIVQKEFLGSLIVLIILAFALIGMDRL